MYSANLDGLKIDYYSPELTRKLSAPQVMRDLISYAVYPLFAFGISVVLLIVITFNNANDPVDPKSAVCFAVPVVIADVVLIWRAFGSLGSGLKR